MVARFMRGVFVAGLLLWASVAPAQEKVVDPAVAATVTVATVGDTLSVTLQENASTGYAWMITDMTGGIVVVDFVGATGAEPAESGLLGAPSARVLRLFATKAGRADVKLRYARPFDLEGEGDELIFAFNVRK
jgi:predicted secreted protein